MSNIPTADVSNFKVENGKLYLYSGGKLLKNPVVVFIYSDSCGYCVVTKPEIQKLHNAIRKDIYGLKDVIVAAVNVKDRETVNLIQQAHNFQGVPCILFFHEGALVAEYEGARKSDAIMAYAISQIEKPLPLEVENEAKTGVSTKKTRGRKNYMKAK